MILFERIMEARGLSGQSRDLFLKPDYSLGHDPFLLPDMAKAVDRLSAARQRQEHITVYGDYDIDGLTATSVLLDAFASFGFLHVDTFIPNRFVEGYGMTVDAIERIAKTGATLVVTVDCGSLSEKEIVRAKELGVDVIVTDHHNVALTQPPAVAIINPKRLLQDYPTRYKDLRLIGSRSHTQLYPFLDLPGVGVAFKLVQALQTKLDGLPYGQEKWLLDLVALGTVCDVVTLVDENRTHVYYGLQVLARTRRPGLKALMAVSGVDSGEITARSLGFALGPRLNAAGRLETARHAQDLLTTQDATCALEKAQQLDEFNAQRRADQDDIFRVAIEQASQFTDDHVLVVSHADWNHGIIGIVAAKLLEKYKKPTYVLQEIGPESKGSARSYGDFSAADAIRASDDLITKGGGHKFAAGVTLPTANIEAFRLRVNEYFESLKLSPQAQLLLPVADVTIDDFSEVTEELVVKLRMLEPCGNGNPEPILKLETGTVLAVRRMGADSQHLKLEVRDVNNRSMQFLAFNAPAHFFVELGKQITVWFQPSVNEWQGRRTVEGRLLHLEVM
ncbi:single-stranded DNA exonuclease RecJ [Candidatus Saccharibacteria bacterium]|nr:single-stranded DNA exonuclease RecJ [Candidatus Saccharibacteria bacterium]